ncbi:iron ABC transporter permease [Candidatus Poribacteria bacterium]|nr:iron ABC transporter permease [Candidatus Poribacteria bacterium]
MKRLTAKRWFATVGVLSALALLSIVVCALIGPTPLDLRQAFEQSLVPNPQARILFGIRLPRILLAGLIGGALAGAGVVFQAILRNPLAEPYVLGVSSGAALGAAVGILADAQYTILGYNAMTVCAFAGALLTILFVYAIAQSYGRVITHSLLLTGVIVNYVIAALIMLITSLVDFSKARDIIFWLMGNLDKIEYRYSTILINCAYILTGLGVLLWYSRDLNLLSLGEASAGQLGVEVEKLKKIAFVATSLITAAAVAEGGPIGFVGLIMPHAMRMILGPDHRLLLPAAFLGGGIFLILSDTVARVGIRGSEIPVGVITALCGGPLFIFLLRRQIKRTG